MFDCDRDMAESGIDLGYDLSALLTDDFDIESAIDFDDLLGTPKNQEFYELTSKTMPVNERWAKESLSRCLTHVRRWFNCLIVDLGGSE